MSKSPSSKLIQNFNPPRYSVTASCNNFDSSDRDGVLYSK